MNILILSAETAQSITDNQSGQHRLGPAPLMDGRFFLSDDVLTEPHFAAQLEGIDVEAVTLDDIQHLLPVPDETS